MLNYYYTRPCIARLKISVKLHEKTRNVLYYSVTQTAASNVFMRRRKVNFKEGGIELECLPLEHRRIRHSLNEGTETRRKDAWISPTIAVFSV